MDSHDATTSSNSSDSIAVGIDLGTTYTSVAVYFDGKIEIVSDELGRKQFPSRVEFNTHTHIVGKDFDGNVDKTNVVFDAKRLIGCRIDDPFVRKDMKNLPFKIIRHSRGDWLKIEVTYRNEPIQLFPESVSALVLSNVKQIVDKKYGTDVTEAVVTVPAYFNNSQRETTKFAAHIAGFKTVHIINEPTAAAIGYITKNNIQTEERQKRLIFDLGESDICE